MSILTTDELVLAARFFALLHEKNVSIEHVRDELSLAAAGEKSEKYGDDISEVTLYEFIHAEIESRGRRDLRDMLYRMFRVAGIETVDQLCALSGHDLMDLSNFSSVRLTDARIGLMRLGRTLRGDSVVGVQRALKQLYGHDLSESVRAQRRLGVGSPIV